MSEMKSEVEIVPMSLAEWRQALVAMTVGSAKILHIYALATLVLVMAGSAAIYLMGWIGYPPLLAWLLDSAESEADVVRTILVSILSGALFSSLVLLKFKGDRHQWGDSLSKFVGLSLLLSFVVATLLFDFNRPQSNESILYAFLYFPIRHMRYDWAGAEESWALWHLAKTGTICYYLLLPWVLGYIYRRRPSWGSWFIMLLVWSVSVYLIAAMVHHFARFSPANGSLIETILLILIGLIAPAATVGACLFHSQCKKSG